MSMAHDDGIDDLHLTRLTLDRFAAVTFEARRQATIDGDKTAVLVAEALESVLRRRLAAVLVVQSVPRPEARSRWWMRWERKQGDAQQ